MKRVSTSNFPVFAVVSFARGGLEVFSAPVDMSNKISSLKEAVLRVFEMYDSNQLEQYFRSQPVPKNPIRFNQGRVLEIVSSTFSQVVLNPRYDVFVFLFMPGCQHCKNFGPVFNDLAKVFTWRVTFATADGTANDFDGIALSGGYPSIWLYPKGNKSKPIEYSNNDRSKATVQRWLEEQLGTNSKSKKKKK